MRKKIVSWPIMRIKTTSVVILLALSLLISVAWAQPPGSGSTGSRLIPVRMGIPVFGVSFIPYLLARDRGFYQEEGLGVQIIVMKTATALAATVSGAVEFNGVAGTTIAAAMQGVPVKLVLALSRTPKYWLFSAPEIRSMAELAGHTVAVGTRGGAPHIHTLLILDKFGLTDKVGVVPMAGRAARAVVASFLAGKIRAGYASDSTYFELKDRGFRELLFYGDYVQDASAGVGTSQKMIETKPKIVQRFVDASYRGMLLFKQNRRAAIKAMIRHMKLDERRATRTYDLVAKAFGVDGAIDYESIKDVLRARKKILDLTVPVPPLRGVFDGQFVAKLPHGTGRRRAFP